jgi:hypothetical protein
MTFGPELNEALPEGVRRLLERLAARGQFDAFGSEVVLSGGDNLRWKFAGRLPVRDLKREVGLGVELTTGEMAGTCEIGEDGALALDTDFSISSGQVAGRPFNSVEGELNYRSDECWVRLENLHARFCDGVAQCSLWIDPDTSEYELSLTLNDVSAAELFPPPAQHPERRRAGRVDGQVWVRGRSGANSTRRGGGMLRFRAASLLQTPVLASVAEQREEERISDTVDLADVRFLWKGEEISFGTIDIQTPDLRLVGEGTWDLRSDAVRMTMWAAAPKGGPRVLLVTDFLEAAGQELVQYRVDGTLSRPQVTPEPLYRLNEILRRFIGQE